MVIIISFLFSYGVFADHSSCSVLNGVQMGQCNNLRDDGNCNCKGAPRVLKKQTNCPNGSELILKTNSKGVDFLECVSGIRPESPKFFCHPDTSDWHWDVITDPDNPNMICYNCTGDRACEFLSKHDKQY